MPKTPSMAGDASSPPNSLFPRGYQAHSISDFEEDSGTSTDWYPMGYQRGTDWFRKRESPEQP